MTEPDYDQIFPEHAKARAVRNKMSTISEFIEWLNSEGYQIVEMHCTDYCRTHPARPTALIAEHFGIDEQKFSDEKNKLLEMLQEQAAKR